MVAGRSKKVPSLYRALIAKSPAWVGRIAARRAEGKTLDDLRIARHVEAAADQGGPTFAWRRTPSALLYPALVAFAATGVP